MREVVLDTETTGIDPAEGHRVIEVAAIELVNLLPTGRHFHTLINPERDIPAESTRIHGFTQADVTQAPRFAEIAGGLLAFLADSPVVAHNAPFDAAHLNAEFERLSLPPLPPERFVDTLALAKTRFPGLPNSLDALCRRFGIDLSERTTHNALLDVRLLAQVYLELRGGRQPALGLSPAAVAAAQAEAPLARTPRPIRVPPERAAAHREFLAKLKKPLWLAAEE
ncbi:MAG: DNA polymerase III subunit epsilon [Rhodovarius sp.]|nr:DNA polymerase III subunit epsilon [Rhodovarius sp.]